MLKVVIVILFVFAYSSFAQDIRRIERDIREIKEKMATKEELKEVKEKMATKEELREVRNELKGEMKEVREKMVTREEFKLFVEMVNKRFEDMHNYMTVIFIVLGLIQGFIMVLIGVMGFRLMKSINEIKEMVRKEVIYPELERMKE